jgi:hypothetical protein
MAVHTVVAKVDQIVTKRVQLTVDANSTEDAREKAREALQAYPEAVKVAGVLRMFTTKSTYWIPKSVEFINAESEG